MEVIVIKVKLIMNERAIKIVLRRLCNDQSHSDM